MNNLPARLITKFLIFVSPMHSKQLAWQGKIQFGHLSSEVYHRQCSCLILSSVCHNYLQQIFSFWLDMQFFIADMQFLQNKTTSFWSHGTLFPGQWRDHNKKLQKNLEAVIPRQPKTHIYLTKPFLGFTKINLMCFYFDLILFSGLLDFDV